MSSPSPFRRYAVFACVALVAVLGAIWVFSREAQANNPPPAKAPQAVQVTSTQVKAEDVPVYRTGIGTVTAAQTVTVKTRIDGQLEKVGYAEGQDVKAGQLIAQLDPRTLEAQLAQAQAAKAKDVAQLGNARIDLQRYTTLIGQDAATQQQLDTQKALVAQLDAAVKTDDAAINYAQVQLGYTRITAPISGRVGARLVDPGNIVHAADTTGLVVINQVDPISVVFTVPEGDFQDINRALNATRQPLDVVAYPRSGSEPLGSGKLVLLNNQIDTTSGTVQMKAMFPNPSHALWPGQYVNVRLVLGDRKQALTVPAAVVQRSQSGTYAYVVKDDGTVAAQPIQVAQIQDGIAVVDQGLAAGQRVVVDGQYKLKPGISVTEAKSATPKKAGLAAEQVASGASR